MLERRKVVIALGRQRFIDARREVQEACAKHTTPEAEALGMTLDELRNETVDRHIELVARIKLCDPSDMLIRLGADNEQEANTLIDDRNAEISRALGN